MRDEKAKLLGQKAELLKEPTDLAKKRDDYLKHHLTGLGPSQIDGLVRKMEQFDYSILPHQISVNQFNIVDRCEVCHAGIREPLDLRPEDLAPDGPGKKPDSLARAFVSHPDQRTDANSPGRQVWLRELSLGQRPRHDERRERPRAAQVLALAHV